MRSAPLRAAGICFAFAAPAFVSVLLSAQVSPPTSARAGAPLPGVTPAEFEEFRMGLEDFLEVETSDDGLGPAFNGTSCAGCHNVPAVGGVSPIAEVRAGRIDADGKYGPVDPSGDSLYHLFSIPSHGCQPIIPPWANIISRRVPLPLFGAGLVEAIDDDVLRALADSQVRARQGISGRAAEIIDRGTGERRVGRFGWKAQHATLLAFSGDAYRNEMGITNDLFPTEVAVGIDAATMRLCDGSAEPEDIPDPRTRRRGIDNFTSFMRFLAPLPRGQQDDLTQAGEKVFGAIGCATCHVPVLTTGPNANPLFHRKAVPLYSDLLLHDVATGDGIEQASAEPNEIRTPALWGLRFRRPLLHDGSAATIGDAVQRHGNEADLAREGFVRLSDADRIALLRFLSSL